MPQMLWARKVAKAILPDRFADWYRRRRATRAYLEALSYELIERETRLDHIEGRIAARRDGFYQRIVTDVLERTEIILQELDRRIEGLSARTGQRLSDVEDSLAEVRKELQDLRASLDGTAPTGPTPLPEPAASDEAPAPAVGE